MPKHARPGWLPWAAREREAQAERDRQAAAEAARLSRLHAAAPMLLGAAHSAVALLKELIETPVQRERFAAVIEQCEAAIAAAELPTED